MVTGPLITTPISGVLSVSPEEWSGPEQVHVEDRTQPEGISVISLSNYRTNKLNFITITVFIEF